MYSEIINMYTYNTKHKAGEELVLSGNIGSYNAGKEQSYKELIKSFSVDDNLNKLIDEAKNNEAKIFEKLKIAMEEWHESASYTKILNDALSLKKANETAKTVAHKEDMICNVWDIKNEHHDEIHEIMNQTYKLWIKVYTRTQYNRETQKSEPVSYEVSYSLYTNSPLCLVYTFNMHNECVQSIHRKVMKDRAQVDKYIEGRKKALSHYFTKDRMPIIKGFERPFKVNGILLDGYFVVDEL